MEAEWKMKTQELEDAEYDLQQSREEYFKRVESTGGVIIFPEPHQIFLDLDTEEHYDTFQKMYHILKREYPSTIYDEKPSTSGLPHRHIKITVPFKMSDSLRIAFQAALGSDPIRELLSAIRVERGDEHPTILVEEAI